METTYLPFAQAGFISLTVICVVFLLLGTYITYNRMGYPANVATRKTAIAGAILIGWLLIVSVLSLAGITRDFSGMPPKFFIVILIPLIAILILTFHPRFREFIKHVPYSWLLYIQTFRVLVELFLWWQFLDGLTPVQMTFEGRNLDILTGITAPVFAWICYGQGRKLHKLALAWNIAGLILLLNIVITAILSAPVPFRVFMNEPANTLIAEFPIVFLPAFLVPLAYSMHFFFFRKLYLQQLSSSQNKAIPAASL
ncbi:hypothetical protein H7F15_05115 [Pontibacter sp. Tf4]|uniref:hypothetical protein n=1 Tax=Pontibacter sp. Tf4 TaxID=2761620 RepID=UPI001623F7F8|nr:hypothetical protein [Pontibacter sp. Tf4]MBB6610411.1 hypothetical protein [Pontibacter sp. Tf4]